MLLGVILVPPAVAHACRREIQRLLLPGQRRLHMSDESDRRRRHILDAVVGLQIDAAILLDRHQPGVRPWQSRQQLIAAAADLVISRGVTSWTLDDVPPADRSRDRNTIGHHLADTGQVLVFDHVSNRTEPLLWAADALCWAAGAGAEWRKRIETGTTFRELDP